MKQYIVVYVYIPYLQNFEVASKVMQLHVVFKTSTSLLSVKELNTNRS